jgi:hypothetical protein
MCIIIEYLFQISYQLLVLATLNVQLVLMLVHSRSVSKK